MHQIKRFLRQTSLTSQAIAIGSFVAILVFSSSRAIPASFQSAQSIAIASNTKSAPVKQLLAQSNDLGRAFKELGIQGSIVIYDQKNQRFYEHNAPRNATAFVPASTFKIFNSLVALETEVIRDDIAVLTWDGREREIPEWNRDTNLRQAYKNSTVWFYQVLARRVGHKRMQTFINQVGYGNRQIGTAESIDKFWLEGPLQITPREQIQFLQRLYRNDLPFSRSTLDLVKDVMVYERTPNYVLRGKTGWARNSQPEIGWFVGYLEQNDNVYFFATNIDVKDTKDIAARIEVTRRSLKTLGLL